jgi:hypothetical protein
MALVCNRHPFLVSENLCGRCGLEFCRDCLVHPRGHKLPLCVTCAVAKAGVRTGRSGAASRRELRARRKQRQAELAEAATPPLPEIVNPVPAGWALAEDVPLAVSELPPRSRRPRRDAQRGSDPLDRIPRRSAPVETPADGRDERAWLRSLHSTD